MTLPDLIETERLTLRPLRPSDAGPMALFAGDLRVAEKLATIPHPYPPGAAEAFIERVAAGRAEEHVWAMDAGKIGGPEFVGRIGIRTKTPGELVFWVGPPFWNTGYATEAVAAVAAAAGGDLIAHLVEGDNASAHVLAHAGFREAGAAEAFGVAAKGMLRLKRFTLTFGDMDAAQ